MRISTTITEDLSQAARALVRHPRFSLFAALVLSLGIGMTTALFSLTYGVLLKPLPFPQQDRLLIVWKGDFKDPGYIGELSAPEFRDWQAHSHAFEKLAAMPTTVYGYSVALTGFGDPLQLERSTVTADFFSLLGVQPALGRTFAPSDDNPSAAPVVVLHYSLWKNRFHSDASIVGRAIALSGEAYTVIGVMPSGFDFPTGAELWTPLGLDARFWDNRDATFLQVVGRLRPGVSLEQARTDLTAMMVLVRSQHPEVSDNLQFPVLGPISDYIFGDSKPAIFLLWAASILLLVIACANITSLLLARAIVREKEVALRVALGATSGNLLRQFLAEGLILALVSAVGGCLLARILLAVTIRIAPADIPRLDSVELNVFALLFACAISLGMAFTFGLAPALLTMKRDLRDLLNEGTSRIAVSRRGTFLRKLFIVAEVAVTVLLLVCAGAAVHGFHNLQQIPLGFTPQNTLTAHIPLANLDSAKRKAFFIELLDRLRSHGEVRAAGAVLLRPLEGTVGWDSEYQARGQDVYDAKRNPISNFEVVTPGYFAALGTPFLAGRDFTAHDNEVGQPVMIVSQSLAQQRFGSLSEAIGKQIKMGDPTDEGEWHTVIGVVADAQYRQLGTVRHDIFLPFLQTNVPLRYVLIRTKTNPDSFVSVVRQEVASLDKNQPVSKVRTMQQLVDGAKAGPRLSILLLSVFAVFAAFLAALGVYGLVSDSILQRRREIGIRMALGAQSRNVLFFLARGEMTSVFLGECIGLTLSLAAFQAYGHFLYRAPSVDFISMAMTLFILSSVTLAACLFPALRATQAQLRDLLLD
ncbi:MAG TPA: ABC transporter permease [Candidatus Saccharimonadales bacterium]|nr:ABC transporter permease [Candidatus Saccharimonadales bacterium]